MAYLFYRKNFKQNPSVVHVTLYDSRFGLEKCPVVTIWLELNIFLVPMIKNGKFHIDHQNMSHKVKWGQKVIWSVNHPNHKFEVQKLKQN